MLQMTTRAVSHIEQLRAKQGHDGRTGVRFLRRGGRLGLTFAANPASGDRVVPCDGVVVYLASDIAEAFERSVIDAETTDGGTKLVVRRKAPRSGR
jgi:Fe-S cluster assembly iron-binding protein IscA